MNIAHSFRPDSGLARSIRTIADELLCFVLIWSFLFFWYGDVLVMARDYSFFSSDMLLMRPISDLPFGWLWVIGRALLCLFAHPWLGSAVLALLLVVGSRLFGLLVSLPQKWKPAQYLPALAYLFHMTWQGFDAFVYAEPGRIMGIPFAAVTALLLLYLIVRMGFRRAKRPSAPLSPVRIAVNTLVPCAMLAAIICYGQLKRPEVRITAHLQQLMKEQEWEEMIQTAEEWEGSCRPVAAYHAIALLRTGRLTEGLFNLRYDFDPIKLTKRNGQPADGLDLYEAEADLQTGLWQTAYRKDMETTVLDGISTQRLRRMAKCAILNGETNLALRYLHVLSTQPFERPFIRRYRMLALQPGQMENDSELAFIRHMQPASDAFESYFMPPMFIGFHLANIRHDNPMQAEMSVAASLYAKNMPAFLKHVARYPQRTTVSPVIGDALALAYLNNQLPGADTRRLAPYVERIMSFSRDVGNGDPLQTSDPDHKLFHKYRGFYPYYYFFGNRDMNLHSGMPPKDKEE